MIEFIRKNNKLIFNLLILVLLLQFGCKTYPIYNCYKPEMTNVKISWGVLNNSDSSESGFRLTSNGYFENFSKKNNSINILNTGYLDSIKTCKILKYIKHGMMKTQTLYEPGDIIRFITLTNEETSLYWKVRWNTKFSHDGNKLMNSIYDSLSKFIQLN